MSQIISFNCVMFKDESGENGKNSEWTIDSMNFSL